MEENQYNIALPIWLDLIKEQPDNSNVNYKIGLCYIHSANDKKKALDYLVKAVKKISSNYDPFSASEKKAPNESYFYLARAYHLTYKLDSAISTYTKFKEKISKKHYLFKEIDHNIAQCNNAKEAVKDPVNIKINNLGHKINSSYADYSPVLSLDESSIYFTSRRVRKDSSNLYVKDINDGQHYEDIYVSHNYDGSWTEPELIGVNTEGHEATLNISVDGQMLFIFKDDNGDGNIYISKLEGEEWGAPIKLGSDINLESRETHAHVSPDGNTLYYVSDRKGGLGGQDIYMCKRLPNGDWAKSQNLGATINTPYDEDGIFVHPDGRTIYFSSKGHKSIGGYDIFFSEKDELGNWSTPVNMGYPINSTDDDVFFTTSVDGKRGYYSSIQEKGYGEKDIYVLSLEDANAKPVTLLTGYIKVLGKSETPENAQVVVTNNETGDLMGIYKPRKKDGRFSIILTPGNDYHIVYSADVHKQEEDLYIPPISAYQEISRGIDLKDVIFGDSADIVVNEPLNYKKGDKIEKLKVEVKELASVIEKDKALFSSLKPELEKLKYDLQQIENQLNEDKWDDTPEMDMKIKRLEKMLADLKAKLNTMKEVDLVVEEDPVKEDPVKEDPVKEDPVKEDPVKEDPIISNEVIASYQEFFKYNIKEVNTSNPKYTNMVSKAIEKVNKDGKVTIDIESSASKVPTKTFKTNTVLAYERAIAAKKVIINSLIEKGIQKDKIIIKNIDSGVNGPQYRGDFNNIDRYEKYQYVIIKIK